MTQTISGYASRDHEGCREMDVRHRSRCFTDDDEDPAIVLTTGKIPEYDGYELVCRIRPIPDVVQMTLNDDGEVMA